MVGPCSTDPDHVAAHSAAPEMLPPRKKMNSAVYTACTHRKKTMPGENASDLWARGILTGAGGPEEGTAVNSVSWARIKASLSK